MELISKKKIGFIFAIFLLGTFCFGNVQKVLMLKKLNSYEVSLKSDIYIAKNPIKADVYVISGENPLVVWCENFLKK